MSLPALVLGGFLGVDYFGDASELGDARVDGQTPNASIVFGARISYLPIVLAQFHLGAEGEVSMTPSSTDDAPNGRPYFAPVFGYRAHAIVRYDDAIVRPHLVLGFGGETITSRSTYVSTDTDAMGYWGLGASLPVGQFEIRIDARQGAMESRSGGTTSAFTMMIGLGGSFGAPSSTGGARRTEARAAELVSGRCSGSDGTVGTVGTVGRGDCAAGRAGGTVAGGAGRTSSGSGGAVGSGSGAGAAGKTVPPICRAGAGDGQCAYDRDGRRGDARSPDVVIDAIAATHVTFEDGRARLTDDAKRSLAVLVDALAAHPDRAIAIVAHPDASGDVDLAHRRAETIKWHLVDSAGLLEVRVTTRVGAPGAEPIEILAVPHE